MKALRTSLDRGVSLLRASEWWYGKSHDEGGRR